MANKFTGPDILSGLRKPDDFPERKGDVFADAPASARRGLQQLQAFYVGVRIQPPTGCRPRRRNRVITVFPCAQYISAQTRAACHHLYGMGSSFRISGCWHVAPRT